MSGAYPDIIPFPGRCGTVVVEQRPPVLIISSQLVWAEQLGQLLQTLGFSTRQAASADAALQWLQATPTDVCILGDLPPADKSTLLQTIQQRGWSTQVLQTCAAEEWPTSGATVISAETSCVLRVPREATQREWQAWLIAAEARAQGLAEARRLRRQLASRNLRELPGQSPAMQALRFQVQSLAEQSGPVLLVGERGCGLLQVAQAIHDASRRAHRPFVFLDCSVHSAETLEEELLGSAPSPGVIRTPGRLEQADGGTLLLEHVDQIALPLQRRLATIFADQRFEVERTGERIRFDVRLMLATHADLDDLIRRGLFRPELLRDAQQRRLEVAPLRQRVEDIAPLAEYFLRKIAAREGKAPRSLTIDALRLLQGYHWPGNVAELELVLERACAIDAGRRVTPTMLMPWLAQKADDDVPTGMTLAEMERHLIEATFARFAGNREKTAKALQIGIRTLSGKLREYGYPPRGGPGSNQRPWTPTDLRTQPDQKAA
ncbi:MAG: nitrogen regulation protein NR(I) [Planctomycetaceae bacterium]|nr:MAG: nitrogen regulation protein NR(I) [Planctomycetaceae bacterium]